MPRQGKDQGVDGGSPDSLGCFGRQGRDFAPRRCQTTASSWSVSLRWLSYSRGFLFRVIPSGSSATGEEKVRHRPTSFHASAEKKGTVHPLIPQWIPMSPSVKPERRHLNADDRQLAWQHPYPNPPSSRRFNAAADETLRYSETRSSSAAVPGSDSDAFSAAAAASSRAARRRLP